MDFYEAVKKTVLSLDDERQKELHYRWSCENLYNLNGYIDAYWKEEMPLVAEYFSRRSWLPDDIMEKVRELQMNEE
jgi:hypothetical protein